jgi:hypothetical protein
MENPRMKSAGSSMPPEFSMRQYWVRKYAGHVPKLSFAGTTLKDWEAWRAEAYPRLVDIIGYINPWAGFGLDRGNYCGSQVVPGIYRWFDTHDIAGLIAPRPLLIEMGEQDDCFFFEDLRKGYDGVDRIYRAAGAGDRLLSDVGSGGHAFVGGKAFDFFRKNL